MQDLSKIGNISELKIDGNRALRYLKTGNGDPLILLHTIRTQLDYFESVIPQLAKHFTVYAIELPGHGYSSIDKKASYDEPYFRSSVIAFIEKLDLKEITLAGESIGGVLALTVASQLPSRVKQVVSSNPYDYDKKYGDGVRRGNVLANFVISQFAIPYVGAVVAALTARAVRQPTALENCRYLCIGRLFARLVDLQRVLPIRLAFHRKLV